MLAERGPKGARALPVLQELADDASEDPLIREKARDAIARLTAKP
jgi:hypothetical protein